MSTVKELAAEVAVLRREIADLREQLAGEVRTRRLVVVDESGQEVVSTDVTEDSVTLRLGRSAGDASAMAEMSVWEDDGLMASFTIIGSGDVVATLDGQVAPWGINGKRRRRGALTLMSAVDDKNLRSRDEDPYLELTAEGVAQRRYGRLLAYAPLQHVPPAR